jgi:methionyl-tRNA synthetase
MKTVGSRLEVIRGDAHHTSGGLTIKDMKVSKSSGEVVSKKKATQGKKNDWAKATAKARKDMVEDGTIKKDEMVLFNQGPKGKRLYELTKMYQSQ